ncbi:MAG: carboxypeptidase regulatory-like domain-containing protein [Acidobacteria bacterium]|nr:carboxypeptidase regulatory-like domain-containing protein [Acidobacteriota bacterium]
MKSKITLRLLFLFFCTFAAYAQTATTTTLSGFVSDQERQRISAALITLTELATNREWHTLTDAEGRYQFSALPTGRFHLKVTAPGFKATEVREATTEVAKNATINVLLEVGEILDATQVVAGRILLQTNDASIGSVFSQTSLQRLPNPTRQSNQLFQLQAATTPTGEFAGARQDQSTVTLDGVDVSDNARGEFGRTVIPTPVETIREMRSIVANANATFGRSSGGQFALVTKSGTNDWHGSAYWFHQNGALSANSWTNNRLGIARPFLLDNRFGFTFGGPLRKDRTFFFVNYEGRRHPDARTVTRIVPTVSYRNGSIKTEYQQLDLAQLKDLDERGLGVNPTMQEYLRLYPLPNDFTVGDQYNLAGFTFAAPTKSSEAFGVLRLDQIFNSRWSANLKLAGSRHLNTTATQVSLLTKSATNQFPYRPLNAVASVTAALSPRLTNELRGSWLRDKLNFENAVPQAMLGLSLPLRLDPRYFDNLVDSDAQRGRRQARQLSIWQWADNLTWNRNGHSLQAGTNLRFIHSTDFRNDKVYNVLSTPLADVGNGGARILVSGAQRPFFIIRETPLVTTLKSVLYGNVYQVPALFTRDADLQVQPLGTGLNTKSSLSAYEVYFSDTWRVKPSFTVTYGVTYNWQTPPVEASGKQTVMTYKDSGRLVEYQNYLDAKRQAALRGEAWNPELAYVPLKDAGRKTAFDTDYTNLSPRVSLAWNPNLKNKFLGDYRTVIRAGYSLQFDRANTVQTITIPTLGIGFSQTQVLTNPRSTTGEFFRVGVDGAIPLPTVAAKLTMPIVPEKTLDEIVSVAVDPHIKTPRNHVFDVTIQRELPHDFLLEIGWVGRLGRKLYANGNLNSLPLMFRDHKSGQTLARAIEGVLAEKRNNRFDVPPQPYFENLYGEGSTGEFSTYLNDGRISFFQQFIADLRVQRGWMNGPTLTNLQVQDLWMRTSTARSNYHALFVALHKPLSFDVNYTLSKSLDNVPGLTQNDLTPYQNSFEPDIDYSPSLFDLRHLFKASGFYNLPFTRNRLIRGWYAAGIFTAHSGLPLTAFAGSDGFGGSSVYNTFTGAIALPSTNFDSGVHRVGDGLNLFANPEAAMKSFRPVLPAQDHRHGRGALRALARWNLDASLGKETALTERVKFTFSVEVFNVFNHVLFNDPKLDLRSALDFGALTSQFNAPRRIQIGARVDF